MVCGTRAALDAQREAPRSSAAVLTSLAIVVGFIAAAFPHPGKGRVDLLGMGRGGGSLVVVRGRVRSPILRMAGVVLLSLAVGRVIFVDTSYEVRAPYWPVLNDHALPGVRRRGLLGSDARRHSQNG